ncbi:hypothetical protein INT43_004970 [Umbelopsis isabellina]|uniref:Alpha-L-rhamnosidase six-hairpin glycosidase domain-containing protein n=1 Tax=Mortierella isabellina TaxID=91625 RepID=A0A8H7PEG9_MORIS|nr:hypothetical protein INT43_004970 [Umbelopsis isabellina]
MHFQSLVLLLTCFVLCATAHITKIVPTVKQYRPSSNSKYPLTFATVNGPTTYYDFSIAVGVHPASSKDGKSLYSFVENFDLVSLGHYSTGTGNFTLNVKLPASQFDSGSGSYTLTAAITRGLGTQVSTMQFRWVLVGLACLHEVKSYQPTNVNATSDYTPVKFYLGNNSSMSNLSPYSSKAITLDTQNPVLTLDYGAEVAGFPFVEVTSLETLEAQIELKYSEPYGGLELPVGDGPLVVSYFVNGLMNSFRTETFNISTKGRTESFFLQGGQRWQTITLLSNTSIVLNGVGFKPSAVINSTDSLPGLFSSSQNDLNSVWGLGARAVQAACVEAYSQPSTWEVTKDGALIRGQFPAVSAKGVNYGNYTMSFATKITRGGTGWRVAGGANGGYGPYFVLTASGPQLLNADQVLLPPNSLTAGFGFSIVNQTILGSAPISHYNISMNVALNRWYEVSTTISPTGYNISINGTQVAFVPSDQYVQYISPSWGTTKVTDGTWGFGPYLDQAAYVKNVKVVAENGTVVYTNDLTSSAVYEEYSIASNSRNVCLDGAKRDRLVWIGDFVHTARILAASTGRFDTIKSMIEFEFDWQLTTGAGSGLVPIQAYPGAGYTYRYAEYPSEWGEQDYPILFLVTVGDYYKLTNDLSLLKKYWSGIERLVDTIVSRYVDNSTNLLAADGAFWFTAQNSQNATAPTALFAIALNQLAQAAEAIGESTTANSYQTLSQKFSTAINSQLWSDKLGSYELALSQPDDTSLLATAFAIRGGMANTTQATSSINKLSDLFYQIGYKDSSTIGNSASTQLSPNVQGFVLESLFLANTVLNVSAETVTPVLKNMLEVYWPSMVNNDKYYTGASWEYVYPDGSPGIGIFTSLSHPWGGAPTYILSDYVLGVRKQWNATAKSFDWIFDPVLDVTEGLGITWAKGRVPIPESGYIQASWSIANGTTISNVTVGGHGKGQVTVTSMIGNKS